MIEFLDRIKEVLDNFVLWLLLPGIMIGLVITIIVITNKKIPSAENKLAINVSWLIGLILFVIYTYRLHLNIPSIVGVTIAILLLLWIPKLLSLLKKREIKLKGIISVNNVIIIIERLIIIVISFFSITFLYHYLLVRSNQDILASYLLGIVLGILFIIIFWPKNIQDILKNGESSKTTKQLSSIESTKEWYRDLLMRLLAWGAVTFIIMSGWLITERDKFSFKEEACFKIPDAQNDKKNYLNDQVNYLDDIKSKFSFDVSSGKIRDDQCCFKFSKYKYKYKEYNELKKFISDSNKLERTSSFVFLSIGGWIFWIFLVWKLIKKCSAYHTILNISLIRAYSIIIVIASILVVILAAKD